MKKLITFLIAAAFIMASSYAFACPQGDPNCEAGPTSADWSADGLSPDSDYSSSSTGNAGNNNDNSEAFATSWTYGKTENFASAEGCTTERVFSHFNYEKKYWYTDYRRTYRHGYKWSHSKQRYYKHIYKTTKTAVYKTITTPNEADAEGTVHLHDADTTKAWSWSFDSGRKSGAGAGAVIEGDRNDAWVGGSASGPGGDRETSYSKVGLGGQVSQGNDAGETGYGDTYAIGGNTSQAGFSAYSDNYDEGNGYADTHVHGIDGAGAKVEGKTIVEVDPSGDYRSASAFTENMARVTKGNAEEFTSFVQGGGGVAVNAAGAGAYGGGSAHFNYLGGTSGSGYATINSQISPNGVNVSGSAHAEVIGNAPEVD